MKFDLTKKTLLQSTMDTLECGESYAKEVITALIESGEELTEKTVIECDEYLQYDGRA